MNVDAHGKVSSTLPTNPHNLKAEVVAAGIKAAAKKFGSFKVTRLRRFRQSVTL
jgi:NaMN:DMB phosphoribosyltransferase